MPQARPREIVPEAIGFECGERREVQECRYVVELDPEPVQEADIK
jgi:hypothetical protein